jgi:hypothetical protein
LRRERALNPIGVLGGAGVRKLVTVGIIARERSGRTKFIMIKVGAERGDAAWASMR